MIGNGRWASLPSPSSASWTRSSWTAGLAPVWTCNPRWRRFAKLGDERNSGNWGIRPLPAFSIYWRRYRRCLVRADAWQRTRSSSKAAPPAAEAKKPPEGQSSKPSQRHKTQSDRPTDVLRVRRRQALPQAGSILMKDRHCRWFFCEYKTWQGHFQHHGALSHGEESRNEPNQPPNQPPMLDSLLQR
eukprot:g17068.t1